jgi:ribokinase
VRHPAFAVKAIDTTGCGDTFHGVYAAELARGVALAERIRRAAAAAAIKATCNGAQKGIPDRGQVDAFLAEQPKRA